VLAGRGRAWLVLLVAGLAWALAYLALPRHTLVSDVLDDAGGFVCAAAVLVGVRLHRPARPAPWILAAAAQACSGAGDTLFTIFEDVLHTEPFPSVADVFYLAAYPLLTAALFLLVRRRTSGRDLAGLLDAGIVSAGLGLLSWTFLMRPIAADDTLSLTGQLVGLAYPLGDVVLIAVLARLLTTPGARTSGFRLLTAALLLVLAADVGFAVLSTLASYDGGATDALWILAYACWGAAALHPSMRTLADAAPAPGARLTFRRFVAGGGRLGGHAGHRARWDDEPCAPVPPRWPRTCSPSSCSSCSGGARTTRDPRWRARWRRPGRSSPARSSGRASWC
jgi:hypothetical protein